MHLLNGWYEMSNKILRCGNDIDRKRRYKISAIKLRKFIICSIVFYTLVISLLCSLLIPVFVDEKMVMGYLNSSFLVVLVNLIIFKCEKKFFAFSICLTMASIIFGSLVLCLSVEILIIVFFVIYITAVLLPYFWVKKFYK